MGTHIISTRGRPGGVQTIPEEIYCEAMRLFSAMFTRDILDKSIWINLGAVSYPGSYMRLLREYFGELLKTHVQIKVLIKKKHIGTTDFDIYRSNYWKGNI